MASSLVRQDRAWLRSKAAGPPALEDGSLPGAGHTRQPGTGTPGTGTPGTGTPGTGTPLSLAFQAAKVFRLHWGMITYCQCQN